MVKLTAEDRRSAALLFSGELAAGTVHVDQLNNRLVQEAVATRRVPSRLSRALQQRQVRLGRLTYEGDTIGPFMAARRGVLGAAAEGPPRFLIRLDAHAAPLDAVRRVHAALAARDLPHLVTIGHPLELDRIDLLATLRRHGASFGLLVSGKVAPALEGLAEHAVRPRVAVVPESRLGWREWTDLSDRFDVITPESEAVRRMGWHRTPMFLGRSVWMPCPAPLCGPPGEALAAVRRLVAQRTGLWTPVALDAARDRESPALEPLLDALAGSAASWDDLLDAVEQARRVAEVAAP